MRVSVQHQAYRRVVVQRCRTRSVKLIEELMRIDVECAAGAAAQGVSPSSIKLAEELMCKEVECAAGAVSQVMVVGTEVS